MKPPICSIIAPTYRRIKRAEEMMQSVLSACDNNFGIEFVLRMQEDDEPTIRHIPEFLKMAPFVRCVVGLRHRGYQDHGIFFMDAARIADGQWCWFLSDDCTVAKSQTAIGFDTLLANEPRDAIIQPAVNRLNTSTYLHDEDCPGFFVPTGCWYQYVGHDVGTPIDLKMFKLLRSHGWGTRFIDVEFHHHRDSEEALQHHRAP